MREVPVKPKIKVSDGNRCSNYSGCVATITTGSLNLTIDTLALVLSDRFGVTTDKIKMRTIELFGFPAK